MRCTVFALLLGLSAMTPAYGQEVPESQAEISLSFAPVVRQTAPAVVNIYATVLVESRESPFAGDPFFEQFFQGMTRSRPRLENSLGSGVIVGAAAPIVLTSRGSSADEKFYSLVLAASAASRQTT